MARRERSRWDQTDGDPKRAWLYETIFEQRDTRAGRTFDVALLALIVVSLVSVSLDSVESIRASGSAERCPSRRSQRGWGPPGRWPHERVRRSSRSRAPSEDGQLPGPEAAEGLIDPLEPGCVAA